ncbi:MAG: type II and III secretion system protein family protein [Deltaproteobacteria bacterium]
MDRRSGPAVVVIAICLGLLGAVRAGAGQEGEATTRPEKTVRVFANQSVLLDSGFNIKRVSVARAETADVMVVSPRQMVVIGRSLGTTTLVYWSEEEVPTTVEIVVGIDVEQVRADLLKVAPEESFEITSSGETLILSGTVSSEAAQNRLVEGAKAYAKTVVNLFKVAKLEQVLLQIRVSEVDRSLAKELGFNMLFEHGTYRGSVSPGNAFSPFFGQMRADTIGQIGPNQSFSDAMNIFVAKPGAFPKFSGFLRVLHDRGALKTLAEPNLVVANGAEGKFLVGGEFPIVYTTAAGGSSSYAISYKEFGIRLNFQPKIAGNGDIYMKVSQEVSELDFANAVILSGFRIPALKSRKAESGLQLADGQTFVLAGLIDNKTQKQVSKIPFLGDIPILGALFRNTRYSSNETELMVMVTPKIVRPLDKEEIPALPTERAKSEETAPALVP